MDCVEELLDDLNDCEKFDLELTDWEIVTKFLPDGWQAKAFELKAIKHTDEPLGNPENLLKIFLLYLISDCGLRQVAVKAVESKIVPHISSVSLWKRLSKSSEWLSWMCSRMKDMWVQHLPSTTSIINRKIKLVDATHVTERGSITSSWRVHYAIELDSLQCDELTVTTPKVGESLKNFHASPGDVYIGDRAYATHNGIASIVDAGGDVLLRCKPSALPLQEENGCKFNYLKHLETLRQPGSTGEWEVYTEHDLPIRICAVRKSKHEIMQTMKKLRRRASKKGHKLRQETIDLAKYIIVVTTLRQSEFGLNQILELYRCRWLIELVFKRLKSLLNLGGIPKKKTPGAQAWLYGKLLVALIIESMIHAGESFFPWGFPITKRNMV